MKKTPLLISLLLAINLIALTACGGGGSSSSPASSTTPPVTPPTTPPVTPTGASILVPLYEDPSDTKTWNAIISAKAANPTVPIVAIINPNNGPGNSLDPTYAAAVAQLKAAGIIVYGYIATNSGGQSLTSMEAQMSQYVQWYGTTGMFFDEMAYSSGFESYYSALTQYAKSLGMLTTIGNPGSDTLPSYIGTVSTIVIFEQAGYPTTSFLSGGWHATYAPSNFAYISYGVPTFSAATELANAPYVQYQYISDQTGANPYNALPSYFASEVSTLASK
ncbi:spherulation-specific family 4 protein [Solimicrobium silvestre]|uniref:Spherulation-specific family 4 n=1 Tax=Solimicrobium silvestre TaxID=2099400 RepID=A0A2S9GX78_9BURK|nr:spherulation-specific family 4 protein [Solimicrobium silvestre]PRC92325.1 Spherulation-specific family 4 [Solimicrobium silvestre]